MRTIFYTVCMLAVINSCYSQPGNGANVSDLLHAFWKDSSDHAVVIPFYRKFTLGSKQIVFFGTRHDRPDSTDSMYVDMEQEINALNPDIMLTEGLPLMFDDRTETTRRLGDYGFVAFTGYERGIQVSNWDIPCNDLYYALRKKYAANELYVLLVIQELARLNVPAESLNEFLYENELKGWPLTPDQKKLSYFFKQYKKFFTLPVTTSENKKMPVFADGLYQQEAFKKFYPAYQINRDLHLINMLRESLRHHDRIFVQAGAMHLLSLQRIIPLLLKEYEDEKSAVRADTVQWAYTLQPMPDAGALFIKKWKQDKGKIILVGTGPVLDTRSYQHVALSNEIDYNHPDLILTQGNGLVYESDKMTMIMGGIAGYCRRAAMAKDIRVSSWEPTWNEVYYSLRKNYSDKDIYHSVLCWSILQKQEIPGIQSMNEIAVKTLTEMSISGFPMLINTQEDLDLYRILRACGGQAVYSITPPDEVRKVMERCINPLLINDLHTIKLAHLIKQINTYRKQYRNILVQADWGYMPAVDKALGGVEASR